MRLQSGSSHRAWRSFRTKEAALDGLPMEIVEWHAIARIIWFATHVITEVTVYMNDTWKSNIWLRGYRNTKRLVTQTVCKSLPSRKQRWFDVGYESIDFNSGRPCGTATECNASAGQNSVSYSINPYASPSALGKLEGVPSFTEGRSDTVACESLRTSMQKEPFSAPESK